jgi:hypothetical protein
MESGFRRFFWRKRSKSKPLAISAPLPDTFRQTGGYHEYAAGPPPTVGALPIKPSDEKTKPKSFSHIKTKSVGLQEFKKLVHTDSGARPRTAPGVQSNAIGGFDSSRITQTGDSSTNDMVSRSRSIQATPKVPELPKGLSEMGGSKYFDLLQAAVLSSKAKPAPDAIPSSFDYYNESVADRNSFYGKPPKQLVNKHHAKSPSISETAAPPKQSLDAQRASFDAMRAARDATMAARSVVAEKLGATNSYASTIRRNYIVAKSTADSMERSDAHLFDQTKSKDLIFFPTQSENNHLKRKSSPNMEQQPPLLPIPKEQSSFVVGPSISSTTLTGQKPVPSRQRSKTLPTKPNVTEVSETSGNEIPGILTLRQFEEPPLQDKVATGKLVSSSPMKHASSSATSDPISANQPPISTSDHVPPRKSSERSARKRDKSKRHSREASTASNSAPPQKVASAKGSFRKKEDSKRTVIDLTAEDSGTRSDEEEENDYDDGIEDAITHQADPVQLLRASVVSANDYVYKSNDNVIRGKILNHRPSRGLSNIEMNGLSPEAGDINSPARVSLEADSSHVKAASVAAAYPSEPAGDAAMTVTEPSANTGNSSRLLALPNGPVLGEIRHPGMIEAPGNIASPVAVDASSSAHQDGLPNLNTIKPRLHVSEKAVASPAAPAAAGGGTPTTALNTDPQRREQVPYTNGVNESTNPPLGVVARDFATSTKPVQHRPGGSNIGVHSITANDTDTPTTTSNGTSNTGSYVHLKEEKSEGPDSELDRIIAIKKKAAAQALWKLQQVMVMPTWEEPSVPGQIRGHRKGPSHWRDLSIEDGSPIAPSAIFKKVKIPVITPPLSRHATFSGNAELGEGRSPEGLVNGIGTDRSLFSLQAEMMTTSCTEGYGDSASTTAQVLESPERPWLERRGRSESVNPKGSRGHERMGSAVSTASGTSAYSLPYHMVPARGSSMRDSESNLGDYAKLSRFHVGELGWQ